MYTMNKSYIIPMPRSPEGDCFEIFLGPLAAMPNCYLAPLVEKPGCRRIFVEAQRVFLGKSSGNQQISW
jgi:hypothetical protein